MTQGQVTIVVSIIGTLGTLGVAFIQHRQGHKVEDNSRKINHQETLLASVLADLEEKERRIGRFEKFFTDIGLIGKRRPKDLPDNPDDWH